MKFSDASAKKEASFSIEFSSLLLNVEFNILVDTSKIFMIFIMALLVSMSFSLIFSTFSILYSFLNFSTNSDMVFPSSYSFFENTLYSNEITQFVQNQETRHSITLKFIEKDIKENVQEVIELKPTKPKKPTLREEQMNAPVFLNKYEKFEWLMKNGCTNQEDRMWLAEYKQSEEYRGLYET